MDSKGIVVLVAILIFFFTIPTPVINSITPGNGVNNRTVSVIINGAKFDKKATVKLVKPGEEDIIATGVDVVSPQEINCSFDLKGKTVGKWDVVVTNRKIRSATLSGGFIIGFPAPRVTGVTPNKNYNNGTVTLMIQGSAFRTNAMVMLTNQQMDIGASHIQVLSDSQISCDMNLNQADTGIYNVKVVNDDQKSGILANGFEVEGSPQPVVEVVKPIIHEITPNKGFNNGMILTNIDGGHFEAGSLVKLSRNGQEDIPGLNIKIEDAAHITCFFDINGQPEGDYNVEVINPSGQKAFLANGFKVEKFVPTLTELNKKLKTIYFDYDKAEIRPNQKSSLNTDLSVLKAYPQLYIILGGHADERGGIEYNLELSARRANTIKKFLLENGIKPEKITIYAYGKEFPAVTGHNESSWWQNRRVEIMVWEEQPPVKGGKKEGINYVKLPDK